MSRVEDVRDLDTAIRRAAARWGDRTAWVFDPSGEVLSFTDIERQTAALAVALAERGVGAGDRVAVMLGNCPEFPLLWLALARLGAATVAVNPRYRSTDLAHLLRTADVSLLVADPSSQTSDFLPPAVMGPAEVRQAALSDQAAPIESFPRVKVDASTVANIQFTSGTTGRPKGCVLRHGYWTTLGRSLVTEFPRLGESDVMLTAQPFSYVDPQWNVVAALLSGARLVVLDGFHPSTFWDRVRVHQVTYFYCLAAMPALLLRSEPHPEDRHHLVRAVQCSAIPPALHAALESRWGVRWYEAFGMTETGADLRVTDLDHDELVGSGCVGGPASHRQVRLLGPDRAPVTTGGIGELCLRGPDMFDGYFRNPDATAAALSAGWFHTGDLARLDDAGRVYLVGRTKDMIRRSGENVAAREVEDVLTGHPGVRLAAVIAVPDELRGEEVAAVVVATADNLEDDEEWALAQELREYCEARLARFKVPRFWELRTELPLTASERVAKAELGPPQRPYLDLASMVRPGGGAR